ncbi:MAG: hypothetical protein RL347_1386 [Actinomycetota bacterium]
MEAEGQAQVLVGTREVVGLGCALGVRRGQDFSGDELAVLAHRLGDRGVTRLPAQGDAIGDVQAR